VHSLTVEIHVGAALAARWEVTAPLLAGEFGIHCAFVDQHVRFRDCEIHGATCSAARPIEYSTEDEDGLRIDARMSKAFVAMPALAADTTVRLNFVSLGSPGTVPNHAYGTHSPFALLLATHPDADGSAIHSNPGWTFASTTAFHDLG
jgi:hypothetical protein